MHPIFSNRFRWILYEVAWAFVGVVVVFLLQATTPRPWWHASFLGFPMALLYASMCLSAWWVCRSAPLGITSGLRCVAVVVGAALTAGLLWAGLGSVWAAILDAAAARFPAVPWASEEPPPTHARQTFMPPSVVRSRDFLLFFSLGTPLYLASAAVHYLLITFENARAAERRALESHLLAGEAEVRALRAQLNPHFLFNSLNSINALVGSDPEGARRMCEHLADFLRQTLALAARATVPLADEIQLVERYLAIEKIRFGERLRSRVRVAPEVAAVPVPPLLLQPLVENAVKHGISERVDGGTIEIDATLVEGNLRIVVSNPFDETAMSRRGAGVGLENVRRRLRVGAAKRAHMTAGNADGLYRVELALAVEPPPGG